MNTNNDSRIEHDGFDNEYVEGIAKTAANVKSVPLTSITPGGWGVEEGCHVVNVKYVYNGNCGYIAYRICARHDEGDNILTDEKRANANAIAAVPEMLGVCIDVFLLAKEHNIRLPKSVSDNLQYALRKAGIYI